MYRMMIVDDEDVICRGFCHVINWENYGIDIAFIAHSGEEALEILNNYELDILITDIRLPGISGIELIRQATTCQPEIKCLVLSGYDNYDLVRDAMKSGASDYLLKPVSPDQLESSIVSILEDVDDATVGRTIGPTNEQNLLDHTMQQIIHGTITPKARMEKLVFWNLDCNPKSMVLCLIRYDDFQILVDAIGASFIDISAKKVAFLVEKGLYAVLLVSMDYMERKIVCRAVQRCINCIQNCTQDTVAASVSRIGRGWRQLPELYEQAALFLDYSGMQVHIQDENSFDSTALPLVPIDITGLRLLMLSGQVQRLGIFLDDLFDKIQIKDLDIDAYSTALSFLRSAFSICAEMSIAPSNVETLRTEALRNLVAATSLQEMKRELQRVVSVLIHLLLVTPKESQSSKISQVLQIVATEYMDSRLCLKTIADRLFVNATYLGRQFKLETGLYFNDFLARTRIRQAEMMLSTTSLKISEIAYRVGYSSVNYFCQSFKRAVGVTPTEVRSKTIRE